MTTSGQRFALRRPFDSTRPVEPEAPITGMTLGVYRVNRDTGEKAWLKPVTPVTPGAPLFGGFPLCECLLCRNGRRRTA